MFFFIIIINFFYFLQNINIGCSKSQKDCLYFYMAFLYSVTKLSKHTEKNTGIPPSHIAEYKTTQG